MTTAVDYNKTSTVWAQDKWKGIFGVKWIFVRDIPNAWVPVPPYGSARELTIRHAACSATSAF